MTRRSVSLVSLSARKMGSRIFAGYGYLSRSSRRPAANTRTGSSTIAYFRQAQRRSSRTFGPSSKKLFGSRILRGAMRMRSMRLYATPALFVAMHARRALLAAASSRIGVGPCAPGQRSRFNMHLPGKTVVTGIIWLRIIFTSTTLRPSACSQSLCHCLWQGTLSEKDIAMNVKAMTDRIQEAYNCVDEPLACTGSSQAKNRKSNLSQRDSKQGPETKSRTKSRESHRTCALQEVISTSRKSRKPS